MRKISETKLVGLIGNPVKHSLSPSMHNRGFEVCGLNMYYVAFEVDPLCLEAALKGMAALSFAGFNITLPFKEVVLPFLDSVHVEAEMIGAVNTVVIKGGQFHGYNTDGIGFLNSLQEKGINAAGKNILLIGAGGAARAVAVSLALQGAESIIIANRTVSRARELCNKVSSIGVNCRAVSTENINEEVNLKTINFVVNATPVGMYCSDDDIIFPVSELPPGSAVCDLVYGQKTRLLQEAANFGHTAVDGSGMLLYQGTEAFRLLTGHEPPVQAMRQALDVAICQRL